MKVQTRVLFMILAVVVFAGACAQNVTDYRVHHYLTRIKADTVVDQRNAWCLWPNNPKPAIGDDLLDAACKWTNPTATVHP